MEQEPSLSPAVYGPIDIEALEALRAPFPPEAMGKLPRVTCQACSKKSCQEHRKARCPECNNYISPAHIHLDYVGHAGVTDRLLNVDLTWTWMPMAFGPDGLPLMVVDREGNPRGLWIWLYVGGVRRPGYGSVESGKADAIKELIGDALRNAGARFGIALELWSKEQLESDLSDRHDPSPPVQRQSAPPAEALSEEQRGAFIAVLEGIPDEPTTNPTDGKIIENPRDAVLGFLLGRAGVATLADFPADRAANALDWLEKEAAKYAPAPPPPAQGGDGAETPPSTPDPPADDPVARLIGGVNGYLEQMSDDQANAFADWLGGEYRTADFTTLTAEQLHEVWAHAGQIINGGPE